MDRTSSYPQLSVHSYSTSDCRNLWSYKKSHSYHSSSSSTSSVDTIQGKEFYPHLQQECSNTRQMSPLTFQFEDLESSVNESELLTIGQNLEAREATQYRNGQDLSHEEDARSSPSIQVLQSPAVSDFRRSPLCGTPDVQQQHHSYRTSSSLFKDDAFSVLALGTLTNEKKFLASSKKFYLIHQCFLPPGSATCPQVNSQSSLTESERIFLKWKSSQESLALLEQCLMHKVKPITVATIIAARKNVEMMAKNFLKNLPQHVVDQIRNFLDAPGLECKSS